MFVALLSPQTVNPVWLEVDHIKEDRLNIRGISQRRRKFGGNSEGTQRRIQKAWLGEWGCTGAPGWGLGTALGVTNPSPAKIFFA